MTAPTGMLKHTQAQIVGTEVHPEAMTLEGADRAKFPKLHVTLGSDQDDGSGKVEYTTWIDDQSRNAWSTSRDVTIDECPECVGKPWSEEFLEAKAEIEGPDKMLLPF